MKHTIVTVHNEPEPDGTRWIVLRMTTSNDRTVGIRMTVDECLRLQNALGSSYDMMFRIPEGRTAVYVPPGER